MYDKVIHIDYETWTALQVEAIRRKMPFATPNNVIRAVLKLEPKPRLSRKTQA